MAKKTQAPSSEALSYSFLGDVDEDNVERAVKKLTKWALKNPGEDVQLLLHSEGGSMHDGWRLFDTLRMLSADGHQVTTKIHGVAASMAAVLFQAGDIRVMGANAWMMIHENRGMLAGSLTQIEDNAESSARMRDHMYRVLAKRSKLNAKEVAKQATHKDWWIDARTALDLKLTDVVEGAK